MAIQGAFGLHSYDNVLCYDGEALGFNLTVP